MIQTPGLILQDKWEGVIKYVYTALLRHMPKMDRMTLGAGILDMLWKTEQKIIQCAYAQYGKRTALLREIDVDAKTVIRMVAAGHDAGIIPEKKYLLLSEKFAEIGKIVGGLLKKASAGVRP